MNKVIILLLFGLVGFAANAQQRFPSGFPTQLNTGWNRWGYAMSDSGLIVANRDTTWFPKFSGTVVFRPTNKQFYWFDSTNLRWNLFGTNIDTTSISNRINLKLNISDTTGKWLAQSTRLVDTMYRVNDSTVGYTIKGSPRTFQILGRTSGGGGSGTVTSVALSMPSAFYVSGSPITTSGTFNVTMPGLSTQYVRANGTVATTDTGMIPNFYLKVRSLLTGSSPITFNQTTGIIGINNATASGTKGAASFTSAFSDNGSGLIDLADLVSNGSCTGCSLNINSKGQITGYSDGAGGGINNVNIGAGFRPVNAITQEMRTYFAGFGQRLDSVANANGLTWSADTSRGSGLPSYFYTDSLFATIGTITANNGLTKTGGNIQLGGSLIQPTNITSAVSANRIVYNGISDYSDGPQLEVTTSGSTGIAVSGGTADGRGIFGQATTGVGVYGTAVGVGGYGLFGNSVLGNAIYGQADSGVVFEAAMNPTSNTNILPIMTLLRSTQSTPANGMGQSIDFYLRSTVSNQLAGQLAWKWTNATDASRTSEFEIYGVNTGTAARKVALAGSGQWTWDGYPSLTAQTDTTTYKPIAIDGSGNVVKMAGWSGSGGGGGGSFSTNNLGSGYRWVATPSGNIKTVYNSNTILWDSTSNTNGLTAKVDTSVIATQYDLTQITTTSSLTSDIPHLSEIKIYSPAQGVTASASVTGYAPSAVDSARYMYSTVAAGTGGSEKGGWLVGTASGDSIKVTAPFWVVFGDSQAEGHPGLHGRLHPLVSGSPVNGFIYNYPDSVGQLSYHLRYLMNMRVYNQGIGGQTTVDCRKRFYRDVLGVNSPNSADGRGDQTLNRSPQGVIIILGINDIFNGVSAQTTKDNLEWMASQCQQTNKRCVILNIPGDANATQDNLKAIASMNEWLASGVMDQYGASVVDYNSWWNDPAYGNDNIHHTSLIVDDIHPSKVGYDSLANYIYRSALLPKLRKGVFINELSPTTPINYARPSTITINAVTYNLASLNDTIDINSYVPDSVNIKVIASTPVTDNDTTGFSHIEWFVDNNPLDSAFYTRKTLYSGSQKANINASQLTLIPGTAINGFDILDIPLADLTTVGFRVTTYAGGARQFLGGSTIYNSASLNITNSATAFGTNGSIYSEGNNSQIAALQLQINGSASNTGVGISVGNTLSSMRLQSNPSSGKDQFRFDSYNGVVTNLSSSKTNLVALTNFGLGSAGGDNQTGNALFINPTINQTTTSNTNIAINGITYAPSITALGNARHRGLFILKGNNYLNALSDSTCIGCDSLATLTAKFTVKGKVRIDTLTAPPSTYNVLVHGLTDSILYQVPVSSFGSGITSFTDGNGFDGTVAGSALSLAPSFTGLAYSDGSALGASTMGNFMSFVGGTLSFKAQYMQESTNNRIWLKSRFERLEYEVPSGANFTTLSTRQEGFFILPDITANRTFDMFSGTGVQGHELFIYNGNTSGSFNWSFTGVTPTKASDGTTVTTLVNGVLYHILGVYVNSTAKWVIVNQ